MDCPTCGKSGVTAEACPRCGCDLTPLRALAAAAAWHLSRAADALGRRRWRTALGHAATSWRVRHTPAAARLAFLAAAAASETTLAAWWHERARDFELQDSA